MTDIKELALKTLGAMAEDGFHVYIITYEAGNERFELDAPALDEYNKRLIAAYLAEQEPVWYHSVDRHGVNHFTGPDEDCAYGAKPLFAAPPLPEPAPQQETIMPGRYKGDALCAAPSSEEVREMVENLRSRHRLMYQASPIPSVMTEAADLIERLAAAGEVKP